MSGLPDRRRLTELEGVIERGRQTFVEVGEALAEIRDQRLYRDTHGTFEDYCRERWSMDRVNAHRHIEAAQVVGMLSTDNRPSTVRQTRELARAEDPAATWQRVTEEHGPQPPARVIREAVQAERAPHIDPPAVHVRVPRLRLVDPQPVDDTATARAYARAAFDRLDQFRVLTSLDPDEVVQLCGDVRRLSTLIQPLLDWTTAVANRINQAAREGA